MTRWGRSDIKSGLSETGWLETPECWRINCTGWTWTTVLTTVGHLHTNTDTHVSWVKSNPGLNPDQVIFGSNKYTIYSRILIEAIIFSIHPRVTLKPQTKYHPDQLLETCWYQTYNVIWIQNADLDHDQKVINSSLGQTQTVHYLFTTILVLLFDKFFFFKLLIPEIHTVKIQNLDSASGSQVYQFTHGTEATGQTFELVIPNIKLWLLMINYLSTMLKCFLKNVSVPFCQYLIMWPGQAAGKPNCNQHSLILDAGASISPICWLACPMWCICVASVPFLEFLLWSPPNWTAKQGNIPEAGSN